MQEWKYATALRTLGADLFVTQLCQNPGKQLMFKPVDKGEDQKSKFTAKKKWGKKALMARLGDRSHLERFRAEWVAQLHDEDPTGNPPAGAASMADFPLAASRTTLSHWWDRRQEALGGARAIAVPSKNIYDMKTMDAADR